MRAALPIALALSACAQPITSGSSSAVTVDGSAPVIDAGPAWWPDADAGWDALLVPDAYRTDASYGIDAPILVDAGPPYDPPTFCRTTSSACSGCASDCACPSTEMIDLGADRLDLSPGGYAFVSLTAQLSDGQFVSAYDGQWTSSDPAVAYVFPMGLVYIPRTAAPGQTAELTVETADTEHTASLLVTITEGGQEITIVPKTTLTGATFDGAGAKLDYTKP